MRPQLENRVNVLVMFVNTILNNLENPKENKERIKELFTALLGAIDNFFKDSSVPDELINDLVSKLQLTSSETLQIKFLNFASTLLEEGQEDLLELCLKSYIRLFHFSFTSMENGARLANLWADLIMKLLLNEQIDKAKEIYAYTYNVSPMNYLENEKIVKLAHLFKEKNLCLEALECYAYGIIEVKNIDERLKGYLSIFSLSITEKNIYYLEENFIDFIHCLNSRKEKNGALESLLNKKLPELNDALFCILNEQEHSFKNFKTLLTFIICKSPDKIDTNSHRNLFAMSQYINVIQTYSDQDKNKYLKQFWNSVSHQYQLTSLNIDLLKDIFPKLFSLALLHCLNRYRINSPITSFYKTDEKYFNEKLDIKSLHIAVLNGDLITVDLLSDVDSVSEIGTPLFIACHYKRDLETVYLLLENTAPHLRGPAVTEVFSITPNKEQVKSKYRLRILEKYFKLGGSVFDLFATEKISWRWIDANAKEKTEIMQLITLLLKNKLNIDAFTKESGYSILYQMVSSFEETAYKLYPEWEESDALTEMFIKDLLFYNADIHKVYVDRRKNNLAESPLSAAFRNLKALKVIFQYMPPIPINAIMLMMNNTSIHVEKFLKNSTDYNIFKSFSAEHKCGIFVADCHKISKSLVTHFHKSEWDKIEKILADDRAPYLINHICLDNNEEHISAPWLPALIKKYHQSQRNSERRILLRLITACLNFDNIKLDLKNKAGQTAIDWLLVTQLESLVFSPAEIVLKGLLMNESESFIKTVKDIIVKAYLDKLFTKNKVIFPIKCQFCQTVVTDSEKHNLLMEFNNNGIVFNVDNTVTITLNKNTPKHLFAHWQYLIEHRGKHHFPEVEKAIEEIQQEIQKARLNQWGIPYVETPALDIANVLFAVIRGSVKVLSELGTSWASHLDEKKKAEEATPSKTGDPSLFSLNHNNDEGIGSKNDTINHQPGQQGGF